MRAMTQRVAMWHMKTQALSKSGWKICRTLLGDEVSDVTAKSQFNSLLAVQLPPNSSLCILACHIKLGQLQSQGSVNLVSYDTLLAAVFLSPTLHQVPTSYKPFCVYSGLLGYRLHEVLLGVGKYSGSHGGSG